MQEWDTTLESEAGAWANRCRFEHQMKQRGENLAWNSNLALGEKALIDNAMKKFFDEKLRYGYGQRSCGTSSACHYTQVKKKSLFICFRKEILRIQAVNGGLCC